MPLATQTGWVLGWVQAVQANFYRVRLVGDPYQARGQDIWCTRRARLKKLGQQIVVGDRVQVSVAARDSQGVIEAVLARESFLPRPAIANADQALLVFALREPPPEATHLSRFLVQAESSGLTVCLIFNKCDLVDEPIQQQWQERIGQWGYDLHLISAKTGMGIPRLRASCQDRISIVTGPSGVGKSSLLNRLLPDQQLLTQAVSGRLRHGRHTTRHVELFALNESSWIADSPGFNQVERFYCSAEGLMQAFPEIRPHLGSCQFRNCLHQQEPGCQIRPLPWERYPIYQELLREVIQQEPQDGMVLSEPTGSSEPSSPRAAAKPSPPHLPTHYRHRSRRQERQRLRAWSVDDLTDASEG
ncbi:MAG: ribosome small subunit-dependent GTPase A [Cyanobacteriota bacterium]|nr:ribosome small subunit-dependent GTPase A [Cyanobacteriota bacterium]